MRRNITQGVPGLGVWYQTGRTDQNPNAWNETHIGLFSLVARSGEAVLKAQKDFADIARRLEVPSCSRTRSRRPCSGISSGS